MKGALRFKASSIKGVTIVSLMVGATLGIVVSTGLIQIFTSTQLSFNSANQRADLQERARFVAFYINNMLDQTGYDLTPKRKDNSVFENTSGTSIPFTSTSKGGWRYVGCFQDNDPGRNLPYAYTIAGSQNCMTDIINSTNSSYRYLGIQHNDECWLPTTFTFNRQNLYSEMPASSCQTTCTHNAALNCGGNNRNAIYERWVNGVWGQNTGVSNQRLSLRFRGDSQGIIRDALGNLVADGVIAEVIFKILNGNLAVENQNPWGGANVDNPELVLGAESIDVLYGEDTDLATSANYGYANRYVNAGQVTNWDRVVSLKLAVMLKTLEPIYRNNTSKAYVMLNPDTPINYNDKFERTVVHINRQLSNVQKGW